MKDTIQIIFLLAVAFGAGLYIRSSVVQDLIRTHLDGCNEAALRLEIKTGNRFLYKFCTARDEAIRRYP